MSRAVTIAELAAPSVFTADGVNDRVGIGTTQPIATLDVGGDAYIAGNISVAGTITYDDVTNVDSIGIITARSGIHVTGGDVGIGTDDPGSLLTLDHATNPEILFRDSGIKVASINAEGTETNIASFESKDLVFAASNSSTFTERLRITSDGSVGIGTTQPTAKLDVAGRVNTGEQTLNNRAIVGYNNSNTAASVTANNYTNTGPLWQGYNASVDDANASSTIYADGSAEFAGNLDVGSGNDSVRLRQNIGSVIVSNSNGSSNTWAGQLNTNTTSTISASGSATFAGDVSIGVGLTISAPSGVGTAFIYGPDAIIIDPSPIGDPSGIVRIRGDLFVEGTETVINSDTLNISDFIIGIASTATTNILADGCGLTFGPVANNFLFENSTTSLKSSINVNLAAGNSYQIDGTNRLSASSLNLGTGTIIQSPASNTLTLETNSSERIRLSSDGHIYLRGSGGSDSYRFAKSGQTSIEGFLSFESLTADRTYTFPDTTGTIALTSSTVANATNAGDADTVDGIQASSFLRSDADDTATGVITFNGRVNIRGNIDLSDGENLDFGSSDDVRISYNANNWLYWDFRTGNGIIFRDNGVDTVRLEDSGIFRPNTDSTGSLGTSSVYWANGYLDNMTISTTLNVRGAIDLADNDVLRLGSGDDAELFCDGSHLYLDLNSGIGNLYVRDGTTTRFTFDDAGHFTATGDITATNFRIDSLTTLP